MGRTGSGDEDQVVKRPPAGGAAATADPPGLPGLEELADSFGLDFYAPEEPEPWVAGTPFTQEEMTAYARQVLAAAGAKPGDTVVLSVSNPQQKTIAQEMVLEGMEQGVKVDVMFPFYEMSDAEIEDRLETYGNLAGRGGIFIGMDTYSPPGSAMELEWSADALAAEDDETHFEYRKELFLRAQSFYNEAKAENRLRWCETVWPTRDWAEDVFPDDPPEEAFRKLGDVIFEAARAHQPEELRRHLDNLQRRADILNEEEIEEIHFQGPGTDLRAKIAPDARFLPCEWKTVDGEQVLVNLPSEEIFTTPIADSVEGTITLTRPVVLTDPGTGEARPVAGLRGRFEKGVLVEMIAPDPSEQYLVDESFNELRNTLRIGEIGLLDQSGPIARSEAVFKVTGMDEQAGAHAGIGASYTVAGGMEQSTGTEGDHIDVVFGSPELKITGRGKNGEKTLIENGRWQF